MSNTILNPGVIPNTADGIADVLENAATNDVANLARIQASVSGAGVVRAGLSADPALARTAMGLGTAATVASTAFASAAQGAKADSALQSVSAATVYSGLAGVNGLVLNGSCQSGTNLGFSGMNFNGSDYPFGSSGCFASKGDGLYKAYYSDNFLPVDPNSVYEVSADIKQLVRAAGNGAYYFGFAMYDVDGNPIDSLNAARIAASDTTLAAPLAVGHSVIQLTSGAGWRNTTSTDNYVSFYTYRDSLGRLYDRSINPYTRYNSYTYPPVAQWNAGGVSGNTVTLAAPWAYANPAAGSGGVWPAGTPVSCGATGGTFNYRLAGSVVASTTQWQRRSAYIGGGVDLTGVLDDSRFRPGTAKVKLLILANYADSTATDVTGFGNISLYRAPITRAMAGM